MTHPSQDSIVVVRVPLTAVMLPAVDAVTSLHCPPNPATALEVERLRTKNLEGKLADAEFRCQTSQEECAIARCRLHEARAKFHEVTGNEPARRKSAADALYWWSRFHEMRRKRKCQAEKADGMGHQ